MLRSIGALMVSRTPPPVVYDTDAQALFDAAQITNNTVKSAVNTLIIAAKANGWWTLCSAIYGFAGDGVSQTYASQHKFNWKDPQDTDAAFRLSFSGTWTHGATGADPNGTNAYANTHIIPSSNLLLNDVHSSYYSRDNTAFGASYDIGVLDGTSNKEFALIIRRSGDVAYSVIYTENAGEFISSSVADSRGYFLNSRTASTAHSYYRNGSSIGSATDPNLGTLPTIAIYLAAFNNSGTPDGYGDKECAFATIGAGISGALAATMYTDINTYQTSLSRNV